MFRGIFLLLSGRGCRCRIVVAGAVEEALVIIHASQIVVLATAPSPST